MKYLLLLTSLFFVACSPGTSTSSNNALTLPIEQNAKQATIPNDSFETGKVISPVNLRTDPTQSFALYLPADYVRDSALPVIIFFDPHGDGTTPLNLYKDLAAKYHYILIGSNSSKNGMSLDQTRVVADNLVAEAKTRFGVDVKRVAFCGFSGGAKVALLSGANNQGVSTIIYCGAAAEINPTHPITLLGFAGKKDMNYADVVAFDRSLAQSHIKHYFVEWNGKHEFPSANVFNDAFAFLTTGVIENYDKKQATITPEKMAQEQSIKQQYYQAMQDKDPAWWKKEIATLNAKKKTDLMYERVLGFISLACYSISNNALNQNNLPLAERILAIYAIADPGNEDCKKFTEELKKRKGLK